MGGEVLRSTDQALRPVLERSPSCEGAPGRGRRRLLPGARASRCDGQKRSLFPQARGRRPSSVRSVRSGPSGEGWQGRHPRRHPPGALSSCRGGRRPLFPVPGVLRKCVEPGEVLVRAEAGPHDVPEIALGFLCEQCCSESPDPDPVFVCGHYEPGRDIADPYAGPESPVIEDFLPGGPGPPRGLGYGKREIERFRDRDGERVFVPVAASRVGLTRMVLKPGD